ncbi:YciI family protein [Phycicoccus sp.]|uniref:YciI family protein n=1 Tax=Phycicoccus sp. TaxID=1902410 RepID=UPI002C89722D|nr:YciI family protein [Phycicoccus sp.]HMM95490.1 YciI family protein [Phycicoccus sp.]
MPRTTTRPPEPRTPFGPKAFVLLVSYTAPLDRVDALLDAHRTWLDARFAEGTFLVSGPQVPRVGGTILATAASRRQVDDLVASDPLVSGGVATCRVVEFIPNRGPWAASTP